MHKIMSVRLLFVCRPSRENLNKLICINQKSEKLKCTACNENVSYIQMAAKRGRGEVPGEIRSKCLHP